jgi:hypothetical protein
MTQECQVRSVALVRARSGINGHGGADIVVWLSIFVLRNVLRNSPKPRRSWPSDATVATGLAGRHRASKATRENAGADATLPARRRTVFITLATDGSETMALPPALLGIGIWHHAAIARAAPLRT